MRRAGAGNPAGRSRSADYSRFSAGCTGAADRGDVCSDQTVWLGHSCPTSRKPAYDEVELENRPRKRSADTRTESSTEQAHDPAGTKMNFSRLFKRAYPYRNLSRELFDSILEMLSEGIAARRGRYGAYLHRDRVNKRTARTSRCTPGGNHQRRSDS